MLFRDCRELVSALADSVDERMEYFLNRCEGIPFSERMEAIAECKENEMV